jgi:uncharacterized protein YndB with AHSA1/START domain
MDSSNKQLITVEASLSVPVEKVWNCWTSPEHITHWNFASDDWCCPSALNDLRKGGTFSYRMEAKDGSFGFDFMGIYDDVKVNELIDSTLGDGRKMTVHFVSHGTDTRVIETFEAENINPIELQRGGWQAILNNFKKHTEAN